MPKKLLSHKTLQLIFSIFLLFTPSLVYGNGAVFSPGAPSAPPHPIQQTELYLIKENVVFQNGKVTATFWVNNPTVNKLKVTMGFPLEYKSHGGTYTHFIGRLYKEFSVKIDNVEVSARLNENLEGTYPIVILWEMVYPAKQQTKFTVQYPIFWSYSDADNPGIGNAGSRNFKYITHTGFYWSKPIQEAVFKYCGAEHYLSLLKNYPSGSYRNWSKNGWSVKEGSFVLAPTPYRIDDANNCIIWERSNWKPQENKDDISISEYYSNFDYCCPWGYGSEPDNYKNTLMEHWCGVNKNIQKGHFAKQLNLDSELFTEIEIEKLTKRSYVHITGTKEDCNGDGCDPFYDLPIHLKTDYQLLLLRYLRNSIIAKYGYQFKDKNLQQCFSNISPAEGKLTDFEIENIKQIRKLESDIIEINNNTWQKIKGN